MIPSVVDSFIITQHNLHNTLHGHPLYIEVDYEYRSFEGTNGLAVGVRVSQGLWDKVRLGFTFAHEGRAQGGPATYQMWGFDLDLRLNKGTSLQAEFARSSSFDTLAYLSEDGGLTFRPLQYFSRDAINQNGPGGAAAPLQGNAFLVRGQTDVSELFKWKRVKLQISAYFTHRDEGFYSTGQAVEQGTTKGGGIITMSFLQRHQVRLKYDGGTLLSYDLVANRSYDTERHIFNIQYSYAFTKQLDVVIQYSHTSHFDGRDGLTLHGNFITLGGNWKVHKLFGIILRQQIAFATQSRQPLVPLDHYATTLGLNLRVFRTRSVDLKHNLDTYISGTGTLRWSGNHAASIGLRTQLSPTADTYIREEVTYSQQGSGLVNTLVIGASNKVGKNTRMYGEYQLDGSIAENNSRAVVGLQHIFPIWRGVYVGVGLERGQFLDPTTGISSRTVGRLSFQLNRFKSLRVSGRYEIRFDDGDENSQGSDRIQFVTMNALTWQFNQRYCVLGSGQLRNHLQLRPE